MKPVQPSVVHEGALLAVIGARQPEFDPLPAAIDAAGLVLTEWEFSAEDLAVILNGGRLRLWLHTFNRPLQPVSLEVVP
jgi:hypothetical protein